MRPSLNVLFQITAAITSALNGQYMARPLNGQNMTEDIFCGIRGDVLSWPESIWLDQERLVVRLTSRNQMPLAISTKASFMWTGEYTSLHFLKSMTTIFVLLTLRERILP